MQLSSYKNIYMIGIGGVSMSGIASILKKWGYCVSGSDGVSSVNTDKLINSGFKINIGHKEENITDDIDLVVYSAAIKRENPELSKALEKGIPTIERGAFLGELTKLFKNTIGIAGTHGKTSTTSMVASCFIEDKKDPTIQVGAYLDIIDGNYIVGNSNYFIIEACEYCNSFLAFDQKSAIVLNIDNDHLDFFGNIENIEKSFQTYVSKLPDDGMLVVNNDDFRCAQLKSYTHAKTISVAIDNNADYIARNIIFDNDGCASFDVYKGSSLVNNFKLSVSGLHNVRNALACIALCLEYNLNIDSIKNGLLKYKGASRRMEYKGVVNNAKVYDDYGHHPTEVLATAKAISQKEYNELWVVWECHTFSRFKEHINSFADSLMLFDHIIVTDIYAARETNTFDVNPSQIVDILKVNNKDAIYISDYNEIVDYLKHKVNDNDIVLTLGAGNVTKISDLLVKK